MFNAILEKSEPLRDYHDINLDVILQRPEHSRRPLFRRFAEDVFRRRLVVSDFAEIADVKKPMRHVFGRSPTYAERAKLCAPTKNPERVIKIDPEWPNEVGKFSTNLGKNRILSAKLGEA